MSAVRKWIPESMFASPNVNRAVPRLSSDAWGVLGWESKHLLLNMLDIEAPMICALNGLAIGGASINILDYFRQQVIHGPGAFVEYATSHDDFAGAFRRKLERELRVMILGGLALPTGQLPL